MKEWFLGNLPTILASVFGSGSLLAYHKERNKRVLEEKQLGTDALKTMQEAYDRFTGDAKKQYEDLKTEVENLKASLKIVTEQLDTEKNKYSILVDAYNKLKEEHGRLKKEFENYKKKHL
jgi:septation ring formation regulator EzrA